MFFAANKWALVVIAVFLVWPRVPVSQTMAVADDNANFATQLADMWQEEKLAHDVYVTLGKNTGRRVFANIQQAEQRHMDAVAMVAVRYGAVLPENLGVGEFADAKFAKLYKELVAAGQSVPAALLVGVKIEEMDIADLRKLLQTDLPQDVVSVLRNLERGSEQHLRAFTSQLGSSAKYKPMYLSQADFDQILADTRGSGKGMSQGRQGGNRGGKGRGYRGGR